MSANIRFSSPDLLLESQSGMYLTSLPKLLILFAVLQAGVAFLTYEQTLTFDEAMWQYIGRNWFRHGLTPYTGGIDNKSPLIFVVFGLSDHLFGVNFWFPRLVGICFQTVGLLFVFKIAVEIFGTKTAWVAVSMYGLSLLWLATGGKYVSYTETYETTLLTAGFYYALLGKKNAHYFTSGLLAGAACLFRLDAFPGLMIILAWLIIGKKPMMVFIFGVFIVIAFTLALLNFSGIHSNDLFLYAWKDNFGSGSVTDHSALWKINNFFRHFFSSELVLFLPGLVGYFFIKKGHPVFFAWFMAELFALSVIGTFSPQHFKSILPALCLINAFSIVFFIDKFSIPFRPFLIMIGISFFPKLAEPVVGLKKLLFGAGKHDNIYNTNLISFEDDQSKKSLGLWIRSNTGLNDRVVVTGNGAIAQAYSERIAASCYFNTTETVIAKRRYVDDINRNQPALIAIPNSTRYKMNTDEELGRFIDTLVANHYTLDHILFGYNLYRLKNGNNSRI